VVQYAVEAICTANMVVTPGGRDGARPSKWVSAILNRGHGRDRYRYSLLGIDNRDRDSLQHGCPAIRAICILSILFIHVSHLLRAGSRTSKSTTTWMDRMNRITDCRRFFGRSRATTTTIAIPVPTCDCDTDSDSETETVTVTESVTAADDG
jgi:hypothetical protein